MRILLSLLIFISIELRLHSVLVNEELKVFIQYVHAFLMEIRFCLLAFYAVLSC